VEQLVRDGRVVYGITTGVGELAGVHISPQQSARLQVNIVRSHSAGVGDPLPEEVVRAMMLLRAHALALGYSGIRPQTLTLLVDMLNRDLHPIIPSQGSVGASGDLAPLAHLALALIGEGDVTVTGAPVPSRDALAGAGLRTALLAAKAGWALMNGKVQDAYALRCMPQVHSASRDAIGYANAVVEIEINAATDNPLIFSDEARVISGGNFHGQPVAIATDLLAIACAELASIAERRIERLVNPHLSGLPAFLTADGGLHSGLM